MTIFNLYIHISSSSSSSSYIDSIDSLDPLLPSIPLGCLLDGIQCLYKADECKSLLVTQHWYVHVHRRMLVKSSSLPLQHLLLTLLAWFVWWEVNGLTTAVFSGTAFRICSKLHTASLYSSHLAFSPNTSLTSRLQLGRIPILSGFYVVDNLSITVHECSIWVNEYFNILLPLYIISKCLTWNIRK